MISMFLFFLFFHSLLNYRTQPPSHDPKKLRKVPSVEEFKTKSFKYHEQDIDDLQLNLMNDYAEQQQQIDAEITRKKLQMQQLKLDIDRLNHEGRMLQDQLTAIARNAKENDQISRNVAKSQFKKIVTDECSYQIIRCAGRR